MWNLQRRRRKSRQWIGGPLRDWAVPYRSNAWFQLGHVLFAAAAISALIFLKNKSFDTLAFSFITFVASGVVVGMTEFGRGTVRAYRRTREIIKSQGILRPRLQVKYAKKLYCVRAGVRAAATDYGVARELIPALSNRWKPY